MSGRRVPQGDGRGWRVVVAVYRVLIGLFVALSMLGELRLMSFEHPPPVGFHKLLRVVVLPLGGPGLGGVLTRLVLARTSLRRAPAVERKALVLTGAMLGLLVTAFLPDLP
ncbi:hypothetical protein [Kitasatospora sp. NPDC056531]|uniref:hypothetical protein n=1 Tax=Kitasatospora sp. NPDC056531 TaxID=3345856 RepID=UPI0036748AF7